MTTTLLFTIAVINYGWLENRCLLQFMYKQQVAFNDAMPYCKSATSYGTGFMS